MGRFKEYFDKVKSFNESDGETSNQDDGEEFFVLGYWINPYRPSDKEYFWMRGFESRKEAVAAGNLKQKRGQPKRFIDWVKGTNKIFSNVDAFVKAANKVGLKPKLEE